MNVISKRGLFERAAKHADARSALQVWFDTAVEAEWKNFEDVRKLRIPRDGDQRSELMSITIPK